MKFTTSWDDGHALDIRLCNLLNKYKIKATFYIPISAINTSLTLSQLKAISKHHEIGAHTITHRNLPDLTQEEQWTEISDSKKILEKKLNIKIQSFCYPRGKFNKTTVKLVSDAGFTYGRTTERFCFSLPKNPLVSGTTMQTLLFKADLPRFIRLMNFTPSSLRGLYDWNFAAKSLLNYAQKHDGIFHLWGHSWEIDKFRQWNALERFFKLVSKESNCNSVTNRNLLS